jgi:hypothetical protein
MSVNKKRKLFGGQKTLTDICFKEVITLAAAVSTIQTKNIAAGLIVLKFQAKIIGHNVSLTKKYSVILIYFRAMSDDRWQSETLLSAEIFFYITSSIFIVSL